MPYRQERERAYTRGCNLIIGKFASLHTGAGKRY